jgi:large subunit ribosomal protein L6
MSRVGKYPISVPSGVQVSMDGRTVSAKGPKGALSYTVTGEVDIKIENNTIVVAPRNKERQTRMLWGTNRSRLQNLVTGVSVGFNKDLELVGVGYRASVAGNMLNIQLGFSHDVQYPIPQGVEVKCEKPTSISIFGADLQQIGQIAAEIRAYRKPEPYKGKGVKYVGEYILRKEGKKK